MRICPEALPFVLPPALVASVAVALGAPATAAVLALVTASIAAFFRDPERSCQATPDEFLAPADGRVVEVLPATDDRGGRIAIFLSLFNVHVARAPHAGDIIAMRREPGGYAMAFREEASRNARVIMQLRPAAVDTDVSSSAIDNGESAGNEHGGRQPLSPIATEGDTVLALMAGAVARRIIPWKHPPATLRAGERIAIIRFGSRAELTLPQDCEIQVAVGDRVRAGSTVVARCAPTHPTQRPTGNAG